VNRVIKLIVPFVCALVLVPVSIFFHECGHYVTGKCFGFNVKFHHAQVDFSGPKEKFTTTANFVTSASGPLTSLLLGIGGLMWLYWSRRNRVHETASLWDWVATALALNLGRGLRSFASLPSHPQPDDEAWISRALGLPGWLLPYFLGLMGILAFVVIIRLHPRGQRLLPISCLLVGGVIGAALWTGPIGRIVFP
jgi:hypothetical protein